MQSTHPLKAFREAHAPKLSQAALAEKLGVHRFTVIRWENGAKIDRDKLSDIARETGIPPRELRPDLVEELEKLVGGA